MFCVVLCVLVFVELKSVVTDSEVMILSNKIKELMEVKTDAIRDVLFFVLHLTTWMVGVNNLHLLSEAQSVVAIYFPSGKFSY